MIGNPTRVGDLAVIIDKNSFNTGLFVMVTEVNGEYRMARSSAPARVVVYRSRLFGLWTQKVSFVAPRGGVYRIADARLKPIRPGKSTPAVTEDVKREATA